MTQVTNARIHSNTEENSTEVVPQQEDILSIGVMMCVVMDIGIIAQIPTVCANNDSILK
jgi:hypothetical protein